MRIVDFHNHYYPPEYVEALKTSVSSVRVTYDEDDNPCVHYPGDYNILVPGHRDIEYRQRVLDEHGVDTQVLSFTTRGPRRAAGRRACLVPNGQRCLCAHHARA
jgi:aminocarboxymuconate-semialdehyde decarboxylase